MMPYVLGSNIFGTWDRRTAYILDYLHKRRGLLLGLIRFHGHYEGVYILELDGLDDVYNLRYNLMLLRREEDRFLVAFYGKLAHGFTRDTFIGGEVTSVEPVEGEAGRRIHLPPVSTSNAIFLQSLRCMLFMERDSKDNGVADELLLLSATPRAWLEDGKEILVERAPTCFGEVSYRIKSNIANGEIEAQVKLPERESPKRVLLKLITPGKRKIRKVTVNGKPHPHYTPEKRTYRPIPIQRRNKDKNRILEFHIYYSLIIFVVYIRSNR